MDASNPLSEQDYHSINQRLTELAQLQQDIQKAALAGCDTAEKAKVCAGLIADLNRIKAVYFPGKS